MTGETKFCYLGKDKVEGYIIIGVPNRNEAWPKLRYVMLIGDHATVHTNEQFEKEAPRKSRTVHVPRDWETSKSDTFDFVNEGEGIPSTAFFYSEDKS